MGIARNTLERLGAVLDEPPLPQPAEPKTPCDASVEFTGVGFRYDVGTADGASARPVLHDVTFRLAERGMTALVGPRRRRDHGRRPDRPLPGHHGGHRPHRRRGGP